MESEIDKIPPKINESKKNNSNFSNYFFLLTNQKESQNLLDSFSLFINKYDEAINSYYKSLTEIEFHFLNEDKFKSSIKETPFFQLGKSIKNALKVQKERYFSVITNDKIFVAFKKCVSDLSKILNESSFAINQKAFSDSFNTISSSLYEKQSAMESKIIDDYISKKYKKNLINLDNEPLNATIEQTRFLEKTFLSLKEKYKSDLIKNSDKLSRKCVKVFNEMKNTVEEIITILKENNASFIDTLQKEFNFISKIGKEDKIEKENKEDKEDKIDKKNEAEKENKEDTDKEDKEDKKNEEDKEKKDIIQEIGEETPKENSGNLNFFNYKLKVIKDKTFKTKKKEDINNDKNDNNKERKGRKTVKNRKTKNDNLLFELDNTLTLTEEDVYNIVSTIYKLDFVMINKTEYDLDKEKKKLLVKQLSEKLFSFNLDSHVDEKITDKEVDELYDLLNNEDIILKFFILLNNYRATGKYIMTQGVFDIVTKIFKKTLDYILNKPVPELDGLVVILSQTFYIMKDGTKFYLQEAIKDHAIFKKQEFWEKQLKASIKKEINKIESEDKNRTLRLPKEVKERKKREVITTKIIPFTSFIKEFGADNDMILKIINPIMDEYELDENTRMSCLILVQDNK